MFRFRVWSSTNTIENNVEPLESSVSPDYSFFRAEVPTYNIAIAIHVQGRVRLSRPSLASQSVLARHVAPGFDWMRPNPGPLPQTPTIALPTATGSMKMTRSSCLSWSSELFQYLNS